jgi:hypothetical protein
MFNKPTSEANSLNKSSCLAPTLGVTKLIIFIDIDMTWVTLCCATDLDVNKPASNDGSLNKSSSLAPT